MRALVTGGSGWLGSLLVAELCRRGHEVDCLVRGAEAGAKVRAVAGPAGARLRLLNGDVTLPLAGVSEPELRALEGKLDRLVHLAALVRLDDGHRDELERVNVDGTRQALALAERLRAARFDYVSSCSVAGDALEFSESDFDVGQGFRNDYERTKLAGENLVRARGARFSVLRVPGVVGDSRTGACRSFEGTFYQTVLAYFALREDLRSSSRSERTALEAEGIRFDEDGRLHLPVHVPFSPDIDCAVVPEDWLTHTLANLEESPGADGVYQLVDPAPRTVGRVLGLALSKLGIAPPGESPKPPEPLGPWGRFVRRALEGSLRHHLPYLLSVPKLASERLSTRLGDDYAAPPALDAERIGRLIDIAVKAQFR